MPGKGAKKGPGSRRATSRKTSKQPAQYTPTKEDRARVSAIIGAGVISETARLVVINPKTGRPLARSTFLRHFKQEVKAGAKITSGRAASTLVEAMAERESGSPTMRALRASIFWLKTRESELFSERRINENIDRQVASEISKVSPKESARIARNVLKQATSDEALERKMKGEPSINDEPLGTA